MTILEVVQYSFLKGSGRFCGVAEMVGPVDFSKSMDFWQLDDELHWLETAPAAVDEEDKLMEGHLLLIRVLVEILDCRIIGYSKVPHGRCLVYKLISTFLFPESTFLWHDEETNGNSIPSGVQFGIIGTSPENDRVFQSKCATRASRDKAFQLLICLVTHCIESLHELVEFLVKIHFTDDLKRFDFDYETMQRLKLKDRFEFPIHLDMKPFTVEGLALQENENLEITDSRNSDNGSIEASSEHTTVSESNRREETLRMRTSLYLMMILMLLFSG